MARRLIDLDVRDILQAKEDPFERIMATVAELDEQDVLQLHATFKPEPLLRVLGKKGFQFSVVEMEPEHFVVHFYKDTADNKPYFHLDNRGLEPPQPMMRTLEWLENRPELQDGSLGLEIWNERVPAFLLPELDESGLSYDIHDDGDETVCIRIWRSVMDQQGE